MVQLDVAHARHDRRRIIGMHESGRQQIVVEHDGGQRVAGSAGTRTPAVKDAACRPLFQSGAGLSFAVTCLTRSSFHSKPAASSRGRAGVARADEWHRAPSARGPRSCIPAACDRAGWSAAPSRTLPRCPREPPGRPATRRARSSRRPLQRPRPSPATASRQPRAPRPADRRPGRAADTASAEAGRRSGSASRQRRMARSIAGVQRTHHARRRRRSIGSRAESRALPTVAAVNARRPVKSS